MNPIGLTSVRVPQISGIKKNETPFSFICPITQDVMTTPVIDGHGHTFEEAAIRQWLKTNPICPMNQQPINANELVPNRALKELIESYQVSKDRVGSAQDGENIPRPTNNQNDVLARPLIESAQDLEQKGLYQDAEELYLIALKYTRKSEDYAKFAHLLVKKEEKERAASSYIFVADLQIAEKKHAEAIVTLNKSLELVSSPKTKEKLAVLLENHGEKREAAYLFLQLAQHALYSKDFSHATQFCLKVLELFPALAEAWKTISAINYEQDPASGLSWLLKGANEPTMGIKQRLELCRMVVLKDPNHLQAKLLSFELNQLKMKDQIKRSKQAFKEVSQENERLKQANEHFKQETDRRLLLLRRENQCLKQEVNKNFLLLTQADKQLTNDILHLQQIVRKHEVIQSNKPQGVGRIKQNFNWHKMKYKFVGLLRNKTLIFKSDKQLVFFDPFTFKPTSIFSLPYGEELSQYKELANGQLVVGWKQEQGISLINPNSKANKVEVDYEYKIGRVISLITELANGQIVVGSDDGVISLFDCSKTRLKLKLQFCERIEKSGYTEAYNKQAYDKRVSSILEWTDGIIVTVGQGYDGKDVTKSWDSTTGRLLANWQGDYRDLRLLANGVLSSSLYLSCVYNVLFKPKGGSIIFCSKEKKEKYDKIYQYNREKFVQIEERSSIRLLQDGTLLEIKKNGNLNCEENKYGEIDINLWDSATGIQKGTIKAYGIFDDTHDTMVFSDGTLFSHDGLCIKLWDPNSGALKRTIPEPKKSQRYNYDHSESEIKQVFILSDDTLVSMDNLCVKLWNPTTGALRVTLSSSNHIRLETMMTLPDGTLAALGGGISGETIMLWNPSTGALKTTLYAGSYIESLLVLEDGTLLSFDNEGVKAWAID